MFVLTQTHNEKDCLRQGLKVEVGDDGICRGQIIAPNMDIMVAGGCGCRSGGKAIHNSRNDALLG